MVRTNILTTLLGSFILLLSGCDNATWENLDVRKGDVQIAQPEAINYNNDPDRIMGSLDTIDIFGHTDLPLEGISEKVPYPGNWWSLRGGGINHRWDGNSYSPAEKYDLVFRNWTPVDGYLDLPRFTSPLSEDGWQDTFDEWYDAMGPVARREIDQSNRRAFDENDNDNDGQIDEQNDWDGLESWFGHCNGWAAAAITVDEPLHPAYMTTPAGDTIRYEISDVKALLTDSYYGTTSTGFLARRCNRRPAPDCGVMAETACRSEPACSWTSTSEDEGSCSVITAYTWNTDDDGRVEEEECRDTNPGSLYLVTTNYLGRHKKAYVIDTNFDWQVWNFPVYRYEILDQHHVTAAEATELVGVSAETGYPYNGSAEKYAYVKMKIWYVSDGINPNKRPVGHLVENYDHEQTLEFVLELSSEDRVIGGEWVGASKTNHPDFVWVPLGNPRPNNTLLSWNSVESVYAKSRSGVGTRKNVNIDGTAVGITDTVDLSGVDANANRVELFVDLEGDSASHKYTVTLTNPDGESFSVQRNAGSSLKGWWPYDFGASALSSLAGGTNDGTWTLTVAGATNIKSWTLSVWELIEDHGNNADAATPVEAGVHDGVVDYVSDEDWFSVTLAAGDTLTAETGLGGLTDTMLFLYGTDGTTQLAVNDDIAPGNYASRIVSTVAEAGTYYVRVKAYQNAASTSMLTGSYTLTVAVDPADGGGNTGGFDWGSACDDGSGEFQQPITQGAVVEVGEIPPNKANVRIALVSPEDVDIQLIDKVSGTEIIAWPRGMLNGPIEECTTYESVEYCYSGYNGTNGNRGHEWIEVRGVTNRQLVMKAYGYRAGDATVTYSWEAPEDCVDAGSGSFTQPLVQGDIVEVGLIPTGKANIRISLTSDNDVDIQLYDGTTKIVVWDSTGDHGLLNGPTAESVTYRDMVISYSGYNGTNGNRGHEYITISGTVTTDLTMKAYAYRAGTAQVDYAWGLTEEELAP